MMNIGFLSEEEMFFLTDSLSKNKGMSVDEYEKLKIKRPLVVKKRDGGIIYSSMKHYGLHDSDLNNFLLQKFGKFEYELDFFYELIYNMGDSIVSHRDRYTVIQTTLILLSDQFTGGNLIIEDKDVHFNKKNMYINFDGNKLKHSVSKVTSGQRRVLVVPFNPKKNIL